MAATKAGIIYSAKTKVMRRIVSPGEDSQLAAIPLAAGEALLLIDQLKPDVGMLDAARSALAAAVGAPTSDGICAVVDQTNKVVNMICADPEIDIVPTKTLVAATTDAVIGATWDGIKFTAPAKGADAGAKP